MKNKSLLTFVKGLFLSLVVVSLVGCANKDTGGGGGDNPEPEPEPIPPEPSNSLKFTATEDESSVGYKIVGTLTDIDIQVSYNNGSTWDEWKDVLGIGPDIPLNNGQSIWVKNNTNTLSNNSSNYFQFTMSGEISASGNVNSMINYSMLSNYCYANMFKDCSSLTTAPELSSETLSFGCYSYMFSGCSLLTSVPALPATELEEYCYNNMFNDCSSLTSTPELPAETLKSHCYEKMFQNCSSLKIVEKDNQEHRECKIFTCPTISVANPVNSMFANTLAINFTDGTPTSNKTYYWENGLKFTATQNGSKVGYNADGLTDINIQVSRDNGITWSPWTEFNNITLEKGQNICVKNNNETLSTKNNNFSFIMSGEISASGNVNSMINYSMLSNYCYANMFQSCKSLITAPALPTELLTNYCYYAMFSNCTSLTTPPELLSEVLSVGCYCNMFYNCISLNAAPELPAYELVDYCYYNMFFGCSSLKIRDANSANNKNKIFTCPNIGELQDSVTDMFADTSGTFKDDTPTYNNAYYWYEHELLKFIATEDNSSVGYTIDGLLDVDIEYSKDNGDNWIKWDNNDPDIELDKGQSICVRNNTNTLSNSTNYFQFNMTGKISASGDVNALINYNKLTPYCYNLMFYNCDSLITAPELPATTLAEGCYADMFNNCVSLTSAPELPATTLMEDCYSYMFYGCSSLTSAPKLPATTLANGCYSNMFRSCNNLTAIPTLSATTLADECYYLMFYQCLNLKIREETGVTNKVNKVFTCPDTTGKNNSVTMMFANIFGTFDGDTPSIGNTYYWYQELKFTATKASSKIGYDIEGSLNINIQYSTDNGRSWSSWNESNDITLQNVGDSIWVKNNNNKLSTSLTQYFKFTMSGGISASGDVNSMINFDNLTDDCYSNMFNDCVSLTTAPALPATELATYCYYNMFSGCTSLTTAPELPAETLAEGCYYNMFQSCSLLTVAPELPATELEESCYYNMFNNCTSLTSATELPADTLADFCYYNMFSGCLSLKIKEIDLVIRKKNKIFICPENSNIAPVYNMFCGTSGLFQGDSPREGYVYYWYIEK